jgi:hypothetical protein
MCAIREVTEETGFNPAQYCREEDAIAVHEETKLIKLYIAFGVPESTVFNPQTRKEISKVEFHSIDLIPKNSYGVHPFIPKLKRWITQKKKRPDLSREITPKKIRAKSADPSSQKGNSSNAATFDERSKETFADLVSDENQRKGWHVSEMFAANARLTGKKYEYDGNPHNFGSMHPRYVNYNEQQSNADELNSSIGIQSSSAVNNSSIKKEVSLIDTFEAIENKDLVSPSSSSYSDNINGSMSENFKFDINRIMIAFKSKLQRV